MIVHEDEDFIIINKPPLVSTLEDRNDNVNILALAKEYDSNAQVCHRLDKETSGALAIARTPEAYKHFSLQLQNRQLTKIYHAVVEGRPNWDCEHIDLPLYTTGRGLVKVDTRKGKEALTLATVLKNFKKHSLVSCQLVTGRMHQLRVHLSHLGFPIAADHTYGGHDFLLSQLKGRYHIARGSEERSLIKRVALHSYQITFEEMNGKSISIEAEYPKDFSVVLKQAAKYQ